MLDSKWLAKVSEAPIKASVRPNGKQARIEDEEPRAANVLYDDLTLRMASAVVDLSTFLHLPCVQFEGSKELEEAMKKAKLEPKNIFERFGGNRWMLEYIQYQEKVVFKARQENEKREFEMLERKERESEAVLDFLRRVEFDPTLFPGSTPGSG